MSIGKERLRLMKRKMNWEMLAFHDREAKECLDSLAPECDGKHSPAR